MKKQEIHKNNIFRCVPLRQEFAQLYYQLNIIPKLFINLHSPDVGIFGSTKIHPLLQNLSNPNSIIPH